VPVVTELTRVALPKAVVGEVPRSYSPATGAATQDIVPLSLAMMENTPEVGCHVPEASPNLYTGPRRALVANSVGEIVQYLELKATGEYEDVTAVCTKASVATLVVLSPPLCVVAVMPLANAPEP
jgi:hypothetical protein